MQQLVLSRSRSTVNWDSYSNENDREITANDDNTRQNYVLAAFTACVCLCMLVCAHACLCLCVCVCVCVHAVCVCMRA